MSKDFPVLSGVSPALYSAGQRDTMKPGAVARADVAAVCVAALTAPAADKVTLELSTDKKAPAPTGGLSSIFDGLKPNVYD